MTPSSQPLESFKSKVHLAVLVALLSFLGALGGTFVNSRLDEARWRRQTTFVLRKETFEKRAILLERTVRAINDLQTLDVIGVSATLALTEGEGLIRNGQSAQSSVATVTDATFRTKAAQAELLSVMTLGVIYFGPKTKSAVDSLKVALKGSTPWWKVEDSKTQALLDAMGAELYLNLLNPE